jgi:pantoate--beta-alanine ligase
MSHNSLPAPTLIQTRSALREAMSNLRRAGRTVGLVPTMGALHAGHVSLVEAARKTCDATIATIFVNPTQFAPHEDLEKYPRTLAADMEKLAAAGADIVFAPASDEVYRAGHSTYVEPPAVSLPLEGRCRPGHFRGVATVVLKLFHMIPADVAFFGQKDYQQSLVIRRMVDDLDVPICIQVCPTVREPDGLAMSSRNAYLSAAQREQALAVSRSLFAARELAAAGERNAAKIKQEMEHVLRSAGIERNDYVAIADPETLEERATLTLPAVALVAVHVGTTRLIDNLILGYSV